MIRFHLEFSEQGTFNRITTCCAAQAKLDYLLSLSFENCTTTTLYHFVSPLCSGSTLYHHMLYVALSRTGLSLSASASGAKAGLLPGRLSQHWSGRSSGRTGVLHCTALHCLAQTCTLHCLAQPCTMYSLAQT